MLDMTGGKACYNEASKAQHQSTRLALLLDAEMVPQWWLLGFQVEDDSRNQHGF